MQFKDVLGQKKVKANLVQMIQDNRLSHALLFVGKEGSGALPLALAFAQYIVCQNAGSFKDIAPEASLFGDALPPRDTPMDSCGHCHACISSSTFNHPDIHFSFPLIPKKPGEKPISNDFLDKWREFLGQNPYGNSYDWLQFLEAENRQGNITAEECNNIIRRLNLKSFENGYKVMIIWMPEYLVKEGNRLLKLIEEPPANTIFLFVAEDTEKILPTILSRCQLINVPRLDREDIIEGLTQQCQMPQDQAASIALQAHGNFREALLRVHNTTTHDWNTLLRDWLNHIYQQQLVKQVKWIDDISKLGREDLKQFLKYFNHMLEQSIRLRTMGNDLLQLPTAEFNFANTLNKISTLGQQQEIILLLDNAAYHIERNANPKMLFHALTIQLGHIIKENAVILTN